VNTLHKGDDVVVVVVIVVVIITTTTKHIYTDAKSGNSWHMFNCKKFPKLQIRPPSLILLMIHPRIGEYFPAIAEK
jgi:hypothetical protein